MLVNTSPYQCSLTKTISIYIKGNKEGGVARIFAGVLPDIVAFYPDILHTFFDLQLLRYSVKQATRGVGNCPEGLSHLLAIGLFIQCIVIKAKM